MSEMISTKIQGLDLNIHPLNIFKKLHLDTKVIKMLAPVVKGLGGQLNLNALGGLLDGSIDLGELIDGLTEALGALSDQERESMVLDLLSGVTISIPGKGALSLDNTDNIDKAFGDDLILMYKVLWKVMEANKLSPFVLISRGTEQMSAETSTENSQKENPSGKK